MASFSLILLCPYSSAGAVLNSLQYNNTPIPEPPLSGCVYNDTPGRAVDGQAHVPDSASQKLRIYSCSMVQRGHACEVSSHDTTELFDPHRLPPHSLTICECGRRVIAATVAGALRRFSRLILQNLLGYFRFAPRRQQARCSAFDYGRRRARFGRAC